ncbi:MAG: CDP-diacylglycerol--serine O-phosphatidyltransferase [Geothrix sp.]|jgi:CDP-diacylglycerol--serine O-phosphatidyltransferase|uniref:CDP-diacylglycerol--serine O-phosphatidyltransferase n=1 Tax=Candidatus Geothrix odensensis TaxID=2954440 RepID=A0A936K5K3_9BACT|nr:CDP-diacylglycerol--serine O-phosphatidyltransferase [Holophagaceae bacterium]MBK8571879.1 CDP-diacylglycerol--serine O-phosphatidyltransferase [Candidatus Geothrix odensensis]MBK8791172.1 CDP-diacylglycerol--serine O-phosphatidyltransferase [Holophagaceae bacterium]MCC6512649.1 CDP-diacylglycerol--serine O-phosphatidyltransferase [Geothrix sp.]
MRRSMFVLPSSITMASVFCGFSSVVMSINAAGATPERFFLWAAGLLVLAGVFDGLDGRVARATNTATDFGVQLDSLADVISFGMAPAILAYRYAFFQLGIHDSHLRAAGWAACFVFTACGALRLARFNVQVGAVDSRYFVGLPIPAGAACVASVIIWHPTPPTTTALAYSFAAGLFLVGLLMVSTIRFSSFKKKATSLRSVMVTYLSVTILLALLVLFQQRFFVGFFAAYIALTLLMNLAWKVGWRGVEPPHDGPEDPETVH